MQEHERDAMLLSFLEPEDRAKIESVVDEIIDDDLGLRHRWCWHDIMSWRRLDAPGKYHHETYDHEEANTFKYLIVHSDQQRVTPREG